jgi:hypothetical protein
LSGHPVKDIAPRAAVTLRPLVTYLIIFDLTLGFLTAWLLLLICGLLGVLTAVLVGVSALAGVVVAVTSWLRPPSSSPPITWHSRCCCGHAGFLGQRAPRDQARQLRLRCRPGGD